MRGYVKEHGNLQWLAPFEKNVSPSPEAFNGLEIPMEERDLRKLSALIY